MSNGPGLTQEDIDHLRYIAENGANAYTQNGNETDTERVTCHRCEYTWDYAGEQARASCPRCGYKTASGLGPIGEDGRGLTTPMCNAIRAAAEDGKTYREIADLFTFIEYATSANQHATGGCSHGRGDYPPVPPQRDPGPINAVDARECANIRERYDGGESLNDIARESGRSQSTVYRHLQGDCSHD